ncbi:hypothetical protein CC1G_09201 [Coprinopsis cinerea okayama7|uniref:Uncharacterized protein n=1 Tax=Coprinopsis cinerea (strain Okayama-7 / 130 / ATCC MYA-4618 / FGSC 9003) TaxID=240176 RepID=A8P4V9_COPC7|nr:hypothetical protein CC1G_09201 [Coprinopsis cinerea okayama7\|eukprot:XP_001838824.2 hypothetical protein CC1G_09201 [Coprinopsis cinerea okayama7\
MASAPPSREFLERMALNQIAMVYATNVVDVLNIGLQLFMVLYGLTIFLDTPASLRKGRARYIVLSFIILVLSALAVIFDLFVQFETLYYSGPGIEHARAMSRNFGHWAVFAKFAVTYAGIALADGILLWRCYIILGNLWWIICLPGLMYLTVIALAITIVVRDITGTTLSSSAETAKTIWIEVGFLTLTVAVNLISTSIIAFRLIRAHRAFSASLPGRSMKVYRVAVRVLVESALPLTFFGVLYLAFVGRRMALPSGITPTPGVLHTTVAVHVFGAVHIMFSALSPQLIIFRVTTGRSFVGQRGSSASLDKENSSASRFLQPIVFQRGGGSEIDTELWAVGPITRLGA